MDCPELLNAVVALLHEQISELVFDAGTVLTSGKRHAYFGYRSLKESAR
jgi:hypothetical protein